MMDLMARLFTIAEAEELLPAIERRVHELQSVRQDLESAESTFVRHRQRLFEAGGSFVNLNRAFAIRDQRKFAVDRLKRAIEVLHQFGCRLKDLDLGLIEFPTLYRGTEVLLCWRPGDGRIRYWYGAEESFERRREIDEEFRAHHCGDDSDTEA